MARTVDTRQVAQRRQAITLAAARLFAAHGFDQTTVAQIARAAGLSPAGVFYYFPDKQAVFRSVFERDLPRSENLVARHTDTPHPATAITELVTELAADAQDPTAPGLLVELLRQAGRDPELVDIVARNARILHDGLAHLITRGIQDGTVDPTLDPDHTARWLLAVVDAVFLNADPAHDPRPALRRTVTHYLAPPPQHPEDT
ncbi:TetR/AcrR family transcriptional regulator [Actinosynnema sp. NPDC002837]